jgi:hypothetical protein
LLEVGSLEAKTKSSARFATIVICRNSPTAAFNTIPPGSVRILDSSFPLFFYVFVAA